MADEIINKTKSPCCTIGIYDNDPLLLKTIGAKHRPKFCSPSMMYCSHLERCVTGLGSINHFVFSPLQLSLVDLAGSERVAKTGATAEQLKVK